MAVHVNSIGACGKKYRNNLLNFNEKLNSDCINETVESSVDDKNKPCPYSSRFLSRMSFQWQFVAAILYVELGITLLLCLRPISSKWWSSLFKSGIAKKVSNNGFV